MPMNIVSWQNAHCSEVEVYKLKIVNRNSSVSSLPAFALALMLSLWNRCRTEMRYPANSRGTQASSDCSAIESS